MSTAMRLLLAFGACVAGTTLSAASPPHFIIGRQISGPDGGWDYTSFDPSTDRLYVAHNASVTEVSISDGDKVRSFGMIAKAHAVVPIPGQPLLLVTSGHDDSVRLLDKGDGHEVAKIAVGNDPDAAFFDSMTGHGIVMDAKAGTVSVIDIGGRNVARTITLKPALEFGVVGKDGTLFVNNEALGEIESADLASGKAGAAIPMPGCEGPTGLGYDARTDRLISACANGKAAIVDVAGRRLVTLLDIGMGPDAVIMDVARRFAYIPCGKDGVLEIVSLDAAGGAAIADRVTTEVGARTGALDPASGALYLPTARFAPPVSPGAKPTMIAGSFHILVLEQK